MERRTMAVPGAADPIPTVERMHVEKKIQTIKKFVKAKYTSHGWDVMKIKI